MDVNSNRNKKPISLLVWIGLNVRVRLIRYIRQKSVNQPTISVCIPVFIRSPEDLGFFRQAMHSISRQFVTPKEVVVSINNNDPETIQAIEQIVKNPKYETKIILNEKLGISSNTNKALENASGDVIKILFQDDFLASPWSLWHTAKAFRKSKIQWLVSQTKVYEQELETITRTFIPKISDSLLEGKNTISSPSVVALRKKNLLPFDEELRILMDCEWYVRMSHSYGPPSFTRKVIAINRDHKGQEQKRNPQTLKLESSIAKNKHRNQFMKKQECICRKEKPDLKV